MRLMTDFEPSAQVQSAKKRAKKTTQGPEQLRLSPEEIRAKIHAHKNQEIAKEKSFVDPVELSPGVKKIQEADGVLKNDPKLPETADKIKDALDTKFVNFNEKERAVLQNILNPQPITEET